TVRPDGSEVRVLYGIPPDLTYPDKFTPTPWEGYTYDPDDNAGRTHPADPLAQSYAYQWNTPGSVTFDAFGRTVDSVERTRDLPAKAGDPLPPHQELHTQSIFDIQGNLLTVTDASGRIAQRHVYDAEGHPLRLESIDSGVRRMVLDAAGRG